MPMVVMSFIGPVSLRLSLLRYGKAWWQPRLTPMKSQRAYQGAGPSHYLNVKKLVKGESVLNESFYGRVQPQWDLGNGDAGRNTPMAQFKSEPQRVH